MSVRLRTKWLWVRISLLSLKGSYFCWFNKRVNFLRSTTFEIVQLPFFYPRSTRFQIMQFFFIESLSLWKSFDIRNRLGTTFWCLKEFGNMIGFLQPVSSCSGFLRIISLKMVRMFLCEALLPRKDFCGIFCTLQYSLGYFVSGS